MLHPARTFASRRLALFASALVVVFGSAFALDAQAPAKKTLTVEDYTKWRNISSSEISGDGNWVAYGVAQSNTLPAESKPVLHLLKLDTSQDVAITDGSNGAFSADSKWFAYQIDPVGGRGGRGGRAG
ncbi:MAG TPA: hypothetical protein VJN96_16265, partial [Vicinamibacterales bacterium]|nr:hypothetical protein [Vicinamibacterales bacterium]